MIGASIAAALRGKKKKRHADMDTLMNDMLDDCFEGESAENIAETQGRIQDKVAGRLGGSTVTFDAVPKKSIKHEKQIDGLMTRVTERMSRASHYNSFAGIVVFFSIYVSAIFMQQDMLSAGAVQASYQTTIIAGLPDTGLLTSPDDLYDWLQSDIVDRGWSEPVCGDGTCEYDGAEFPGFGRFGCIRDCGRYLFTSKITVDLQTIYNASAKMLAVQEDDPNKVGWDIKNMMLSDRKPNFKWNIWSDTMGDFLLEEDASPEDGPKVLEVPDGELELQLYQTKKISDLLDITDITENRPFGPVFNEDTVPERVEGIPDVAYGDKREALAAQSEHVQQLFDYCFSGSIDLAKFDWQCMAPFDGHFMMMFGAYGMNGTIKIGNGTRSVINLVEVPFCELVPSGLRGLDANTSKIALQQATVPCKSKSRRRGAVVVSKAAATEDKKQAAWLRKAIGKHDKRHGRLQQASSGHADGSMRSLLAVNNTADDYTSAHWTAGGNCSEHKDCMQSSCSTPKCPASGKIQMNPMGNPLARNWAGGPGQFCDNTGGCEICGHCSGANAIDGQCPKDLCPGAGGVPKCVDANMLLKDFNCPQRYRFKVNKYFEETPKVAFPPSIKPRYLTPFNRLVGSVLISHKRRAKTSCEAGVGEAEQGILNPSILAYVRGAAGVKGSGVNASGQDGAANGDTICLGQSLDSSPYSVDSVLIPTSSIYNGKAVFSTVYTPKERADLNGVDAGLGFWNHSYDTMLQKIKNPNLINSEYAESFNIYLDSLASHSQASNYITYLREGAFIEEQANSVHIQFVTFNIDSNMFANVEFDFEWETGGAISWDWTMRTLPGPPVYRWGGKGSTHPLQQPLEVISMIFLSINCILEFKDMVIAFRIMRPQNYFFDFWNWIDIAHFITMWAGWSLWISYGDRAWKFEMKDSYPCLTDPFAGLRYFQTNSTSEYEFLGFLDEVSALSADLRIYNEVVGVSLLFFVVRVIKNIDFQERMGVVSRTIISSIPTICHFIVLFLIVFIGYAVTAHVLYGHIYEPCSTIRKRIFFEGIYWKLRHENLCSMNWLFLQMLLAYDPANFKTAILGASEPWAVYIYLYSFLIILFFILFSVMMAILIDNYWQIIEIKEAVNPECPSFLPEMFDILTSNAMDYLIDNKKRMPDKKLKAILAEHKTGLPSMDTLKVLQEALAKSTEGQPPIVLPGGVEIDGPAMRKLVTRLSEERIQKKAISLKAYDHDHSDGSSHGEPEIEEDWVKMPDGTIKKISQVIEKKVYANKDEEQMVTDIVHRYAHESQVEDDKKDQAEMELIQLAHLKRELAMHRGAMAVHKMALAVLPPEERLQKPRVFGGKDEAAKLSNTVRGLLRVTVVEARGLPKMDFLGSTDPYALVFLTEPHTDHILGPITFRTDTKFKTREPVWNADFEFPMMAHATNLTVAVYDLDSLTKDDLIGIANVHLSDLEEWVQMDKWIALRNHQMPLSGAEIRLKVTCLPDASSFSKDQGARELPSLQEEAAP